MAIVCWILQAIHPAAVAQSHLGTPDVRDIEYPTEKSPTQAEIELGKVLFFDQRLSSVSNQSCASCHNPNLGFGDGLKLGIGANGNQLKRNTPHLYNLAWNSHFFWDGRSSSLEEQAIGPIESKEEMNQPMEVLLTRLNLVAFYRNSVQEVYGSDEIESQHVVRALSAFERSIISNNSSYDQYLAGDKDAMSQPAINGMSLFKNKANCIACHDGPNFTDGSFRNLGLKSNDPGRILVDPDSGLQGAFKTPGLRNVALTAPYMHDGSLASMEEVIRFYNRGGDDKTFQDPEMKPLHLTDTEIFELIAFLGALTDPVVVERPSVPPLALMEQEKNLHADQSP